MPQPTFHTKTIHSIISPLADQIDHLIEIHANGEDGNPIEPLDPLILNVANAVDRLMKVGEETVEDADDKILKRDMPPALNRVKSAVSTLNSCGKHIREDPMSVQGREELIDGSRHILQGTMDVLLAYDQYEVRKIVKFCRGLIDYLDFAKIVRTMDELVNFIQHLTPGMQRLTSQVDERADDLVSQQNRERLKMRLEDIKKYTPQLASAMKLAVAATANENLLAKEEAIKQRDLIVSKIVDALLDIIRTLQLISLPHGWEPVDLNELKRLRDAIAAKIELAKKWLRDYPAPTKGPGELAVRGVLSDANEFADKTGLPQLASLLHQKIFDCNNDTDRLCDLRDAGMGTAQEGIRKSQTVEQELDEILAQCDNLLSKAEELQKLRQEIDGKLEEAHEWLADPDAKTGSGSQAVHSIIDNCRLIGKQSDYIEADKIKKLCDEIESNMKTLEPLRDAEQGNTEVAKNLSFETGEKLKKLISAVDQSMGCKTPEKTLDGRLKQAARWCRDPKKNDDGLGRLAARAIIGQARKVAITCPDEELANKLANEATNAERNLMALEKALKDGRYSDAENLAKSLDEKLNGLKSSIEDALTASIADKFNDISTALKKYKAAAKSDPKTPNRLAKFAQCEKEFLDKARDLSDLARQAAEITTNSDLAEKIRGGAGKLDTLSDQVVGAGKVVFADPGNTPAVEHFDHTCEEWLRQAEDLTGLVDDTTDAYAFVCAVEKAIKKDHETCLQAINTNKPHHLLPCAGATARRAQRILMVTKREADNSEDPAFVKDLEQGFNSLNSSINPMVSAARTYAQDSGNQSNQHRFISCNGNLMNGVELIKEALRPKLPPPPEESFPPPPPEPVYEEPVAPPVPIAPVDEEPTRPPTPEIEEDPMADPEIQAAAMETMRMLREFESRGNDLIAAAKKMALLMAEMSRLVNGGDKKRLIKCAKEIASASADVNRIGKLIANQCTDRRIRNDMLRVLEKIPTVATQLKILSTVKATMLGRAGVSEEEEIEATEMLVQNAQNLMSGVQNVIREAEAASIKIRCDAGFSIRWVRKSAERQAKFNLARYS